MKTKPKIDSQSTIKDKISCVDVLYSTFNVIFNTHYMLCQRIFAFLNNYVFFIQAFVYVAKL